LARSLSGDASYGVIALDDRGDRELFEFTTPRLRIRFFPDRFHSNTVILKYVECSSSVRWESERRRNLMCPQLWSDEEVPTGERRDQILAVARHALAAKPEATPFWEFWRSLLDSEQQQLEDIKQLPGWAYRARRMGLTGDIEFQVDDLDAMTKGLGGSFLVAESKAKGTNRPRPLLHPFELRPSRNPNWLAGKPRGSVALDQVPKDGEIRVDWISKASELKRRRMSLDRLLTGKAALPWLSTVLPNGPDDDRAPSCFEPALSDRYNVEQMEAISKALVEGTLTCIQGPPGTGKTSVIAELALQMTKSGKRVLISSQTNLAVDNALERLIGQDAVFPVRIGHRQAIEIDSVAHLHLDAASQRFRDRLIRRSANAEERMLQTVGDARSLLSEDTFQELVEAWKSRFRLIRVASRAAARLHQNQQCWVEAKRALAQAESAIKESCEWAGIRVDSLPRYLSAVDALIKRGVDLDAFNRYQQEISIVLRYRADVESIVDTLRQVNELTAEVKRIEQEITVHKGRVEHWRFAKERLESAHEFNSRLSEKRAKAGFFSGLWSQLTESPKDISECERSLEAAAKDKRVADAKIPNLRQLLTETEPRLDPLRDLWKRNFKNLFPMHSASEIEVSPEENWLRIAVRIATALSAENCTDLLRALLSYRDVRECASSLERKADETRKLSEERDFLRSEVRDTEAKVKNASEPSESLSNLCEQFGVLTPAILKTYGNHANDSAVPAEALSTLEELRKRLTDKRNLIQIISSVRIALARYRERLNQPSVDLREAVLAEADVVGATCSGIAGAKDFENDFDCVIVDEAGRTTPLELVMPIVRGKSVVLVGDHKQLPPFISDTIRAEVRGADLDQLERSIFQRIFESAHHNRKATLSTQYRMAPSICDVVTQISYKETPLTTAAELSECMPLLPELTNVHWVCPRGADNIAQPRGTGIVNLAEVRETVQTLQRFVDLPHRFFHAHRRDLSIQPYSVGIIAMYRQQVYAIENALHSAIKPEHPYLRWEIGTVDSFQGREMDAIIVNFCETDPKVRRFFYDRRRLNVAISRAREHLILIGSLDRLGSEKTAFGSANPIFELHSLLRERTVSAQTKRSEFDA
jgi:ABC-type branched-subunit amino acid transport system ATPase component